MPHDLFGDAVVRPPSRVLLRRTLAVFSIAAHAVAITAIVVAQLFAIGPLPVPRRPLTFTEARLVRLADIEPAFAVRKAASGPIASMSPDAAPIEMPRSIAKETGLEQVHTAAAAGLAVEERGSTGLDGLGSCAGCVLPPPPPPPSQRPVRLHAGMQPPAKVVHVNPIYPPLAQAARREGVVILEAVIDAQGNVTTVNVLRSIPLLDQAAVDAVRQWRFTPTLLNGEPVPIVMTVTVNFTLQR
jgi:periplasmic protein TonB